VGDVAVGEFDTFLHALQRRLVRHAVDERLVLFLHTATGMRDPVSPLAIVGQQQEALGIAVEPAHIEKALGPVDQRERGWAALRVAGRRHRAGRLVEHNVGGARRGGGQRVPVERDRVARGVSLRARLGDDGAIDGDAPGRQQRLGPTA